MKSCVLVAIGLVAISAFQSDAQMFSGANSLPTVSYKVKPDYTEPAKNAGLEGDAVVAVTVDENGLPNDVEFVLFRQGPNPIQDSLGLDEMAVSAVKFWRFRAATKDGKPTSMRVKIVVEFRLPGPNGPDVEQH
jgi:protein TonB